jgi:Xaa-Pro dipeptidase
MYVARAERLRAEAREAGLDAIAVVPGPNMIYLSGLAFHLSERPVVAFFPAEGPPALVVPRLEATKAAGAPYECALFTYDDAGGPESAFSDALAELDLAGRWLGVEGRRIRFLELDLMARTEHGPRIFDAAEVFAELRMRKDDSEVRHMRQAAAIAEAALAAALPGLRPGVTEKQFAAELTVQLLRAGSESELPFTPIVASGPNGANPHGFPTDRVLEPGDVVTVDWGAAYERYFSDITRNFVLAGGEVDAELVRAHEVVREANRAGRAAARPGATGQDVDRATRAVIEAALLGDYFIHRTGHGLGLEGHEHPNMNEGEQTPLAPGMTFTVEPGVYIPGLGGVRIEDDLVVTAGGAESLTTLPRELVTVG